MPRRLKIALVGGPMYDRLGDVRLPAFTAATGIEVEVGARLIHPELNDHLAEVYANGTADYDLISTHTKYAPSQAVWLRPLDDLLPPGALDDFEPAMVELARVDGRLLGVPRNLDTRLLHYRADLFADASERRRFAGRFGRELTPPRTWRELREVALHFTRPPDLYGFAFPGQSSGLWGTYYELTEMLGGHFFRPDGGAGFDTAEGVASLEYLHDLVATDRVVPPGWPDTQFDTVSRAFQIGRVAMIADWPATYGAHAAALGDRFDLALYPAGPAGRFVYSGGFTWAIPVSARDPAASMALLTFLTSAESQRVEAAQGTVVTRRSVQDAVRAAAPSGSREARRQALLAETIATSLLLPPRFAAYPLVEDAVWPVLQRGITGEQPAAAAVREAATRMDEIVGAAKAQPAPMGEDH